MLLLIIILYYRLLLLSITLDGNLVTLQPKYSYIHVGLHVNRLLFLSDFNQT